MTDIEAKTYRIERCFADDRPRRVLYAGLSLAEAQAHCNDPLTRGEGWFDAYYEET
jgi:hypothetical protein